MLDKLTKKFKLVEFNTIAAALSSLSQRVYEVQNCVLNKYADLLPLNYDVTKRVDDRYGHDSGAGIALAFDKGVQAYIDSMFKLYGD